jgi:long-chain acyl-CoA synthetase
MDAINTISLKRNADECHRIHFVLGGLVQAISLAELDRRATSVALHFRALGLGPGQRIGVLAQNGIAWVIIDLAVLKIGAITVGFDFGKFDIDNALSSYGLSRLCVDETTADDPRVLNTETVMQWATGDNRSRQAVPLHGGYRPNQPCAIKFTSGSTAQAKGLEASVSSINDSLSSVQRMFQHGEGDNIQIFQRQSLLQQRYWIYSALINGHDVTVSSPEQVIPIAQSAHPTIIMGVPGFFTEVKRQLEVKADYSSDNLAARRNAIQHAFGGRIRYLWTGSAPAERATLHYYNDCGVALYEGYGLNETCIVSKNCPSAHKIGSVGKVLPNKTVRIDSDGTLVVSSQHPVALKYLWCSAGDNERMFLPSGEVRTQDLGYFDDDGYLYIVGRIDELIPLSCGRKVIVRPIEERIKLHGAVHECVLYGIGKPFLTALVSPASETVDRASLENHIALLNATLRREQQIQIGGLIMAKEQFSIQNGLLTTQLKPIRKAIFARLRVDIEAIYEKGSASVR